MKCDRKKSTYSAKGDDDAGGRGFIVVPCVAKLTANDALGDSCVSSYTRRSAHLWLHVSPFFFFALSLLFYTFLFHLASSHQW